MRNVINISLPEKMTDAVKDGVKKGHFSTRSEFFRALLRLWMEGKLAEDLKESRNELRFGKGRLLKSLKDLRWLFLSGMKILYSTKFLREYKRLPIQIKRIAENKERIFRINPFDMRLNTHKLKGQLSEYCAFSIDQQYRIIFEFINKDVVWFHSVGDHSIYNLWYGFQAQIMFYNPGI